MKKENTLERLGFVGGYALGTLTWTGSFLRRARLFHPRGVVYEARVEPLTDELRFHPHALVRLSGALWKKARWKDVLGCAIRFSAQEHFTEIPREGDQDLLLATIPSLPKIFISPFITDQHNFLGNDYFSVGSFLTQSGRKIWFRLSPYADPQSTGTRVARLRRALLRKRANFVLFAKEKGGPWKRAAKIALREELSLDQERLAFHPFRTGLSWIPSGFVQYLRIGTYNLSQRARMRQHHRPLRESASPFGFVASTVRIFSWDTSLL